MILSPHVFRKNCPARKFLTEHMGALLRLIVERNVNRFERGGDPRGKNVFFEPPCIPQKLPYVKVRTHGGSSAFNRKWEFKPL